MVMQQLDVREDGLRRTFPHDVSHLRRPPLHHLDRDSGSSAGRRVSKDGLLHTTQRLLLARWCRCRLERRAA